MDGTLLTRTYHPSDGGWLLKHAGYSGDDIMQTFMGMMMAGWGIGMAQTAVPDQAKAALERVQLLTKDAATLQQIPKVLRDIEARKEGAKPQ